MAGDYTVKINLEAHDKASGAIQGFSKNLETLSGIGKNLLTGALAGIAGGVVAVGGGIASFVKSAAEASEVQAQLNSVIQSTGGVAGVTAEMVNDLASNLQKTTKFEDDAVISASSMLLTFTKIGKDVFPETVNVVADMATAMKMDLTSASVMVGKALNDPIEGVGALRRVGVSLTEEQEKLIKKMVETGDVAGAQKVILQELNTEFGGSAEAVGKTLPGMFERMKNKIGDFGESIGARVLPKLQRLAEFFMYRLDSAEFEGFVDRIGDFVERLAMNAMIYIPKIITAIGNVITFLQNNKGIIVAFLAVIATAIGVYVYTTIIPAIVALYTTLAPVIAILAAVGVAAYLLYQAWDSNFLGIRDSINNLIASAKPIFEQIVLWLQTNIPLAVQTVVGFWQNALLPALQNAWAWIKTNLIPLFLDIGQLLTAVIGVAVTALAGLWKNVLFPAIQNIGQWMSANLMPILRELGNFLGGKLKKAWEDIASVIDKVREAIRKATDAIKNFKLPKVLTPGSPTPFEIGLRGIYDAMQDIASIGAPVMQARLMASVPQSYGSGNVNVTVDENRLALAIREAIMRSGVVK